jgi:TonB family protein
MGENERNHAKAWSALLMGTLAVSFLLALWAVHLQMTPPLIPPQSSSASSAAPATRTLPGIVIEASRPTAPQHLEPPPDIDHPKGDTPSGTHVPGFALKAPAQEEVAVGPLRERSPETGSYVPDGALTPSVLRSEIERKQDAISSVYERALRHNPSLAGRMELSFIIDSTGRVNNVDISHDSVGDPELEADLKRLVSGWRFPAPPDGEVEVHYPLTFRPKERSPFAG